MQVPGYNVAYVGNIAFEAEEGDLQELMADCSITKVRLHTDKDTGRFKGFAHIHFADEESLDRCEEQHAPYRKSMPPAGAAMHGAEEGLCGQGHGIRWRVPEGAAPEGWVCTGEEASIG
jgi:hypothetical protein